MRSFAQLFQGRTDCFGVYRVFSERQDGKQKGKGTTYPNKNQPDRTLTDEDWEKHLEATQMLGIVPILPDGTCSWFAIDVDDYSLNHHQVVIDIERKELPLVVCRSKSGGAHLYCFIDGFIPASLAVDLAKKWATELGYEKSEIFPKQTKLDEDATGNWIITPYYGGDKAVDFAYGIQGERLSLDEFIQWANAKQIGIKEAPAYLAIKEKDGKDLTQDEIWAQAPPCMQRLKEDGIEEGGRNLVLCQACVFHQKRDELTGSTSWIDDAITFVNDRVQAPLTYEEYNSVIKNYTQKSYQYNCTDQPFASLCDKEACLKRRLGVGPDRSYYGTVEIISMIKIDSRPPIWIPRINGTDIEMNTDTLLNPRKFRMAVADALNLLMPGIKQGEHDSIIGPVMADALTIEPLEELTPEGKTMAVFQEWTKNLMRRGESYSELDKGLPVYKENESAIFFRSKDFVAEYRRIYKDNVADRDLWAALRRGGFQRKEARIGKTVTWVWYYPLEAGEEWFELSQGDAF